MPVPVPTNHASEAIDSNPLLSNRPHCRQGVRVTADLSANLAVILQYDQFENRTQEPLPLKLSAGDVDLDHPLVSIGLQHNHAGVSISGTLPTFKNRYFSDNLVWICEPGANRGR